MSRLWERLHAEQSKVTEVNREVGALQMRVQDLEERLWMAKHQAEVLARIAKQVQEQSNGAAATSQV
jgi:hypothetical protein